MTVLYYSILPQYPRLRRLIRSLHTYLPVYDCPIMSTDIQIMMILLFIIIIRDGFRGGGAVDTFVCHTICMVTGALLGI